MRGRGLGVGLAADLTGREGGSLWDSIHSGRIRLPRSRLGANVFRLWLQLDLRVYRLRRRPKQPVFGGLRTLALVLRVDRLVNIRATCRNLRLEVAGPGRTLLQCAVRSRLS